MTGEDRGPVAVIAGSGLLPGLLTSQIENAGRTVLWAVMDGVDASPPVGQDTIEFRVEKLGALFKTLRARGVRDVCFAGAVGRPRLDPTKFDFKTMTLAPKFLPALQGGDDGTLRVVIGIFEGEGFAVRAAHHLAPSLLPEPGILSRQEPTEADRKDAARAAGIVAALGKADVGQGAVVAQGIALAVEAAPGTDRMLDYVADVAGAWRPRADGARGVLFKGPKPEQDRRADLPVIGPDTIASAAKAGLAGVVIQAGGVMLLDREEAVARADAEGLFLWARPETVA